MNQKLLAHIETEIERLNSLILSSSNSLEISALTARRDSLLTSLANVENTSLTVDDLISRNYLGTGVRSGFTMTLNPDPRKIDISAGVGYVVDNTVPDYPVITPVVFEGTTGLDITGIASANASFLAINVNGAVVQQTEAFCSVQRRTLILLGAVIHSNRLIINAINNLPDVILNGTAQLNDLLDSLRNFNRVGNVIYPNGSNLKINKSAGVVFKKGANFSNDPMCPHVLDLPELTAPSNIRYRLRTGLEYSDVDSIDPLHYDNNGVLAVLSSGFSIQRVVLFASNLIRIQYGQAYYNTMAAAVQALQTENFVEEQNIKDNGLLRAVLIVKYNATNLLDPTQALFLEADRFGSSKFSGGGSPTTNLQQSYNNSLQPQIVTSSNGAVQIKRGSALDSDSILEGVRGDGVRTFSLNGSGELEVTKYKLSSLNVAPASPTSTGVAGELRVTSSHIYVCVAPNTWVRSALTTW